LEASEVPWPCRLSDRIFTQEDPIGLAGGLNLYGFAGGDPVNFSDPFGLCKDANGNELPPEQCRQMLRGAQDAAMANPAFQPTREYTFCNKATHSVASAMNAPLDPLWNSAEGRPQGASAMIANLAAPGSGYHPVSAEEAQALANQGELAIAAGGGHVSTLRQEGLAGEENLSGNWPLVANVGETVGVKRLNFAWPRRTRADVKFYTPDR